MNQAKTLVVQWMVVVGQAVRQEVKVNEFPNQPDIITSYKCVSFRNVKDLVAGVQIKSIHKCKSRDLN